MPDVFTPAKRSEVMARIHSRGNRDTEQALAKLFRRYGITGWRRQVLIRGAAVGPHGSRLKAAPLRRPAWRVRPDFVFPRQRLAVFVDGCFWHGCPKHSPPRRWLRKSVMPGTPRPVRGQGTSRTGKRFWREKLAANRARDRQVNRLLRAAGWRVLRIWEHELAAAAKRLRPRKPLSPHLSTAAARGCRQESRLVARLQRLLAVPGPSPAHRARAGGP